MSTITGQRGDKGDLQREACTQMAKGHDQGLRQTVEPIRDSSRATHSKASDGHRRTVCPQTSDRLQWSWVVEEDLRSHASKDQSRLLSRCLDPGHNVQSRCLKT